MPTGFLNCFVSAVVGVAAAVGTSWYMSASSAAAGNGSDELPSVKAKRVQADSLVLTGSLLLINPETKEPLLEIRDGSIYAQNSVCAEQLGAFRVLAQKLQTTPEDPLDKNAPVFGEVAVNEDGGAYLALLSPKETHSMTIGFDKNEKGCVVSQNNDDNSMTAQAVFLKPTRQTAARAASAQRGVIGQTSATARVQNPNTAREIPRPADLRISDSDRNIRR